MPRTAIEFWNEVGSTDSDVDRLYNFLIERGAPTPSRDLATHLIEFRWREEQEQRALAESRTSTLYQPKQVYSVGQTLHFPAVGNREGTIKKLRAGDNPRLGVFQVISVKFEGDTNPREFAMEYARAHPLNEDPALRQDSLGLSLQETNAQYSEAVRARIVQYLGTRKDFVHAGDHWFLRELIPQINPGYLNIAEAAIDGSGDAVATTELVKILAMTDTKGAAATFAVNAAMATDPRFEDVGPNGDARWFLTHLEPAEALEFPSVLRVSPGSFNPLPPELEMLAAELTDGSEASGDQPSSAPRDEVTLMLTYPHRRTGPLPLTATLRGLLPNFSNPRLKFAFVDPSGEKKIAAYAVQDGNYVAGLTSWFNAWRLAPGAVITIKRGADPLTLVIDPQLARERSLWVRVARVTAGRLTLGTERRPLTHKYDDEMLIVVGDAAGLEQLSNSAQSKVSLEDLVDEIFPEVAKLSSAGNVHAKTVYSALNFVRRTGPRAALTALMSSRAVTATGGGYFVLSESHR